MPTFDYSDDMRDDPLAMLAAKTANDPWFFDHALKLYQERHNLDDEALSRELGVWKCLASLRLCRHPQSVLDCQRIGTAYKVDPAKVAAIAGIG